MNDELRRAREKAAEAEWLSPDNAGCFEGGVTGHDFYAIWNTSWDACLTHLAGAVVFDDVVLPGRMNKTWIDGAKWQHSQMAARVGKAETERACVLVYLGKLETRVMELESYIDNILLPADKVTHVKIIEDKTHSNPFKIAALESENTRLQNRIKELESQVDVSNHNRKIVLLQARVKELESELSQAIGHSNCYCEKCKTLTGYMFKERK